MMMTMKFVNNKSFYLKFFIDFGPTFNHEEINRKSLKKEPTLF